MKNRNSDSDVVDLARTTFSFSYFFPQGGVHGLPQIPEKMHERKFKGIVK